MYASRSIFQAVRRARSLSTVAEQAVNPGLMERFRVYSARHKDSATLVGSVMGGMAAMAGGAAAIVYAANNTMGWQPKLTALETRIESLVKKEDFAKVETSFVKKEELAKVETSVGKVEAEVKNAVDLSRATAEIVSLRAWKDKEISIAGGKASK
jgi:hypothetical protein